MFQLRWGQINIWTVSESRIHNCVDEAGWSGLIHRRIVSTLPVCGKQCVARLAVSKLENECEKIARSNCWVFIVHL